MPKSITTSPFMAEVMTALMNPMKQKPYKESSAKTAVSVLRSLGVTSIDDLRDKEKMDASLNKFAPSTRRNAIFTIVNVAKDMNRADIVRIWDEEKKAAEVRREVGVKTEKQEENWLEWKDIEDKRKELEVSARTFEQERQLIVLSLYTLFPPRRNIDYTDMVVVYRMTKKTNMNYLVVNKYRMRFIFNVYKTSGAYERQVFDVPKDLRTALLRFLKLRNWTDEVNPPLLGTGLHSNFITYTLNDIFAPKRISSSMLRHIFASSRYGGEEHQQVLAQMRDDADKMAHSIGTQQLDYVKRHSS